MDNKCLYRNSPLLHSACAKAFGFSQRKAHAFLRQVLAEAASNAAYKK